MGDGLAQAGRAELEAGGEVVDLGLAGDVVGHRGKQRGALVAEGGTAAGGGEGAGGAGAVEFEVEEVAGVRQQFAEGLGALGFEKRVRVVALRQFDRLDVESFGDELDEGLFGAGEAGVVAVVAEDDGFRVAAEQAGVLRGEGGAERRDGVRDAMLVAGNGVDLAFAE